MATQSTTSQSRSTKGRAGSQMARGGGAGATSSTSGGEPTRDTAYGVVSVLYHALQGAETYRQYIADAQREGDDELVQFFQECREEEQARAERAKALLIDRLEDEEGGAEDEDEDEDEEE